MEPMSWSLVGDLLEYSHSPSFPSQPASIRVLTSWYRFGSLACPLQHFSWSQLLFPFGDHVGHGMVLVIARYHHASSDSKRLAFTNPTWTGARGARGFESHHRGGGVPATHRRWGCASLPAFAFLWQNGC